jgi:hypothetical protein
MQTHSRVRGSSYQCSRHPGHEGVGGRRCERISGRSLRVEDLRRSNRWGRRAVGRLLNWFCLHPLCLGCSRRYCSWRSISVVQNWGSDRCLCAWGMNLCCNSSNYMMAISHLGEWYTPVSPYCLLQCLYCGALCLMRKCWQSTKLKASFSDGRTSNIYLPVLMSEMHLLKQRHIFQLGYSCHNCSLRRRQTIGRRHYRFLMVQCLTCRQMCNEWPYCRNLPQEKARFLTFCCSKGIASESEVACTINECSLSNFKASMIGVRC